MLGIYSTTLTMTYRAPGEEGDDNIPAPDLDSTREMKAANRSEPESWISSSRLQQVVRERVDSSVAQEAGLEAELEIVRPEAENEADDAGGGEETPS